MFLRLGALMGARLLSLPRCCTHADLHQLLTGSQTVLQRSWDVAQPRCAFGKPTRHISCLLQVPCPALAVLGKNMPDTKQPAATSQGCNSGVLNLQGLKGFSSGKWPACRCCMYCVWWLVPPLTPWKEKGVLPEVQTICFYG